MNTKTVQLPIKRKHRRMATIFTLAAILGIVISVTDIHREIARVFFTVVFAIADRISA
jgi:PII-like signaling protein